jgi:hypothetical protein
MALADDLRGLYGAFEVRVCKICALLKTLPAEEAALLDEAVRLVAIKKVRAAMERNGHFIGEKQYYDHRTHQAPGMDDE